MTADPKYNVTLGAAHLGDLIHKFDGSYILTFVGYNAGPGRSRDWIEDYGDPRHRNVDAVDWVESIPFTETRKYVQKVLQNIHVYRSILRSGKAVGMSVDLKRGGSRSSLKSTSKTTTQALKCGNKAANINDLLKDC